MIESNYLCNDRVASALPRLDRIRVLMLSVGHDVTDQRVYGKMARSLVQLGADVTVAGLCRHHRPADVHLVELPDVHSTWKRAAIQPWRCIWRSRHVRADIVHFHDPELLLVLPAARLIWPRARFIYDVHEDVAQLIKVRTWLPNAMKGIAPLTVSLVEKSLSRLAHGVIGVTWPLADKFPHRHRIAAYNFVANEYFDLAGQCLRPFEKRQYDVAHLGVLRPRRAKFLAETLAEFHRRRPGAKSIVFGCPDNMVEDLRRMMPLECEVRGRLPHTEIPAILCNSKIGLDVHPWSEPHLEVALPVKVCEYMACECGVVCSAMPVLTELCREGKPDAMQILQGGEPIEYAAEAIRLLDAIDAGQMSPLDNRRFAMQRMNWNSEVQKVAELYLTLLSSGKKASH